MARSLEKIMTRTIGSLSTADLYTDVRVTTADGQDFGGLLTHVEHHAPRNSAPGSPVMIPAFSRITVRGVDGSEEFDSGTKVTVSAPRFLGGAPVDQAPFFSQALSDSIADEQGGSGFALDNDEPDTVPRRLSITPTSYWFPSPEVQAARDRARADADAVRGKWAAARLADREAGATVTIARSALAALLPGIRALPREPMMPENGEEPYFTCYVCETCGFSGRDGVRTPPPTCQICGGGVQISEWN